MELITPTLPSPFKGRVGEGIKKGNLYTKSFGDFLGFNSVKP
jgi:hypothetical protein